MANNYQFIGTFTLNASGSPGSSQIIDIDKATLPALKMLFDQIGGTSGCSLTIYDGYGIQSTSSAGTLPIVIGGNPNVLYNSNGINYILNIGNTSMDFLLDFIPRWIRLKFQNSDAFNQIALGIYADI